MSDIELKKIQARLREFAENRDWDQFYSPKNLVMALSVEAADIVEHFQWLTEEQSSSLSHVKLEQIGTELADAFIYLVRLADKLDIDLIEVANRKIEINDKNYPVNKAKGNAKKYTEHR